MTQINTGLIPLIKQSFNIELPGNISMEELKEKLLVHINYLIQSDFEKLVFLLYRVDVNEKTLRTLLAQKKGEDVAPYIADLVIERQLQKMQSRKKSSKDDSIPDEDRW
ncbi:MAG: hypothetical protein HOP10_14750 [Chitinophagaceae bacterium]|nr:hypothetical protein [Chitinophagaceae bacterium]